MTPIPIATHGQSARAQPALVLCACGQPTSSQRALITSIEERLQAQGIAAIRVNDLCAATAMRDPRLATLAAERPLLVFACRPRAVRWLLHAAGLDAASRSATVVDLRRVPDVVAPEVSAHLACAGPGEVVELSAPGEWVSWFPVVDRDRCQDCGQCASYCMFGVYASKPDGAVVVAHPHGCKTNCPACARLCPSAAIIFPKHDEAPFDGSDISNEEAVEARTRQYTQQMLGHDPYAALAARRQRIQLLRRRPEIGNASEEGMR